MTPDVTVGIPFCNEEKHLGQAIRSILGQRTSAHLEVLLVDDGSTDGSLAVARSIDDPRVRVLSDGRRRHLATRLNQIVREARAPLVARMDADDVSHPERLARQLESLDADPRTDVVGTWAALVAGDVAFAVVETPPLPPTRRSALEQGILPHATMLARKGWLAAHPYDESLRRSEDRDLWVRTALDSRFAVVPDPLYVVRVEASDQTFLDDYLASHAEYRRLVGRYGESAAWIARARAASAAKCTILRIAWRFGMIERVVHRRGRPPTDAEKQRVAEAFAAIQRP